LALLKVGEVPLQTPVVDVPNEKEKNLFVKAKKKKTKKYI
jgi:hypothetical protein